jgi:hypothetical protein
MECELSTLTVDIFNALDAARRLHVKMTSIFAQKIRIIWYNPSAVDVGIEFVVALDPFKHGPMFGSTVHGVPICLHLGFLTVGIWKALAAFSSRLWIAVHAWTIRVQPATWSVHHVLSD